jgi:hypothetical protein
MSDRPRLRNDVDTLTALVQQAATHLGINEAFVEKDFWAIEVLRVCAAGDEIVVDGAAKPVSVVFKGGTSLSRVYGLIERFSEDIDILVVFPPGTGTGSRGNSLKRIAVRVQEHLGLSDESCEVVGSTTGVHRDIRYRYPRRFESQAATEDVLLEMGSRGGPTPRQPHIVRSQVANYAIEVLGEPEEEWEEFASVAIDVLSPERTLLEKLALLHDCGTRYADTDKARDAMALAGRHFYDVHCLLNDAGVREALAQLGPTGVAELVADVDARSDAAGWSYTPRPNGGFADSAVFAEDAVSRATAEASYSTALGMVHGQKPTLDECLATVGRYRELL